MTTNLDRYRSDLNSLIALGNKMLSDFHLRHLEKTGKLSKEQKEEAKLSNGTFELSYQRWYTEASAVIRQLIPDRLPEFEQIYKGDGKRKNMNGLTYTIQDWLNGV